MMKDELLSIKTIFDNSPIGMVLTTVSGKLVTMNNSMIKMLGYSSFDELKRQVKNMVDDIYAIPELREKIIVSAKTNTSTAPLFLQIKKKDGSLINVRVHVVNYLKEGTEDEYLVSTVEDLRYQDTLERRIMDMNRQFQQLYNSSPSAIFIHQDHIFINFNKKAKELFGLDDPSKSYTFVDISPEQQPDGLRSFDKGMALIEKALAGVPQKFEWELIGGHGEKLIGQIALNRIDGGHVGNLFAIVQDITELKATERKLQEREAILSSIIDSMPFELIVTDLESNVILQNKYTKDIWGDYTGKNVFNAPLNDEAKRFWKKNIAEILQNRIHEYEVEIQLKGKLKNQHRISAPYILSGKIEGGVHFAIDVTERVKVQKLANQNADFLNTILDTIPLEVWVIDGDDYIRLQSKHSQNMWGDMRGKHVREFTFPVKSSIDTEKLVYEVRNGRIIDIEYSVEVAGKTMHVRRLMSPVTDINGKTGYVAISFDITNLKNSINELREHKENLESLVRERTYEIEQLYEELQASNEELLATNEELYTKTELVEKRNLELNAALKHLKETQEQLIQSEKMATLGVLTAGVAHEINNPLNYIMGALVGLTSYFEEFESQNLQNTSFLLHSISVGIERISTIVNGLNLFSHDSEGVDEEYDVHAIIDNCLVMLENKIKDKIEIITEFTLRDSFIKGNVGNLHQVFMNVIYNAIQAIENVGIIKICTSIVDQDVIITIEDNGTGIEAEYLSKITDPFFTTKSPGEGTGLGLSISNRIIKDHHGSLQFESVKNKGTVAIIKLPVIPPEC